MEPNPTTSIPSNPNPQRFNRPEPKDRLILILRLFLPIIIFLVGLMIINSKAILTDKPSWQKNSIGGLFIVYAIFRLYQAISRYFKKDEV